MFARKNGLIALGAALVAGGLAAVALGQDIVPPPLVVTVKVTPSKAGTPRHPQGIEVEVRGKLNLPEAVPGPVAGSVDVWLPKGWVYNGARHPACTAAKLSVGGPSACPPESIIGGSPLFVVERPDASTPTRVTIINGGPTTMYFWTVLQNPARVQAVVTGTLTKLNSPRWSYRLHAVVPRTLQVVAGIPISLDTFAANVRRGAWITTTSCPRDRRWHYRIEISSTSNETFTTSGVIPCRS